MYSSAKLISRPTIVLRFDVTKSAQLTAYGGLAGRKNVVLAMGIGYALVF